jgi:TonB family protein
MNCKGSKFLLISVLTFAVGTGIVQVLQGFSIDKNLSINSVPPVEIQPLENSQSKCFDFDELKNIGFINLRNTNRIYAPYPEEARKQRISGSAVVEVLIDEKGNVQCARNFSGHPLLANAVKLSAFQLHFLPQKQNGRNVRYRGYYLETFHYNP